MTTITFRDGVLAGDTKCTSESGWVRGFLPRKVWKLADGRLCAGSGDYARVFSIVRELQREPTFEIDVGTSAVIYLISANGKHIRIYEDGKHSYEVEGGFWAWGSGMPVALGAMYAGASAREAVRIASLVDPHSGGRVVSVSIAKGRSTGKD